MTIELNSLDLVTRHTKDNVDYLPLSLKLTTTLAISGQPKGPRKWKQMAALKKKNPCVDYFEITPHKRAAS